MSIPWRDRPAWSAAAFRTALRRNGLSILDLRHALERDYAKSYRIEVPDGAWFRKHTMTSGGFGLAKNPRLFEAVCRILGCERSELLRRTK